MVNVIFIMQKLPLVIHLNLLQNCFDKTALGRNFSASAKTKPQTLLFIQVY